MLSKHFQKLSFVLEDGTTQNFNAMGYPAHFLYLDGTGVPKVNRIQKRVPRDMASKIAAFALKKDA